MTYAPDALDRRDPRLIARVLPLLESVSQLYFRSTCEGLEHVDGGPAMFVGNHNGGILGPDLACTLSALWRTLTPESPLYALAHDFAMRQFTPLGWVLQRFGAVAATRANALSVFASGGQILVYPGGDLEAYRHSRRRDEVVLLPRTGFVEVARQAGVPIVPIVAHGAHRSAYIFHEGREIAERLGMTRWARLERFPLALALPWIVSPGPWLPYLPLPMRVKLRVLPKVTVAPSEDARDVALRIQSRMQAALLEMAA